MRTSKYTFRGKEYMLCMSTRVITEMEEEGIDLDDIGADGKRTTNTFKVLEKMIRAGDKYAKMEGIDNPGVVSFDELVDNTCPSDYDDILNAVSEAASGQRNVEAMAGKNSETTRGKKRGR